MQPTAASVQPEFVIFRVVMVDMGEGSVLGLGGPRRASCCSALSRCTRVALGLTICNFVLQLREGKHGGSQGWAARMCAYSLVLSAANNLQSTRLARAVGVVQKDILVTRGAVNELTTTVAHHTDSLSQLEESVDRMDGEVLELREALRQRKEEVQATLDQYDKQLAEQEALLKQLTSKKLSQDAVVDGSLLLLSMVLSRTPLVSVPVSAVSSALAVVFSGSRRFKGRSSFFLHVFALGAIFAYLRVYALRVGAHNSVGGSESYGMVLRTLAGSGFTGLKGWLARWSGASAP